MSEYLVLARKYRSATFDEVVGQEPIAQTLTNAIKSNRVAHAYLFTGTRGVGKTTMARILAKGLNCLSSDTATPEPCNKCDACIAIARGDDIDVIEIDGASNRGIDEIRELRASVIFHPARSRYKVYYIDEVHMLTRDACNALLKTLEEPPGHVKFIFSTTEVEKIPATIVSRCQRFDFRNISTRLIADHLAAICKAEKVKGDSDALFRIARAAAGSMRDGLSLLDQILASGTEVTDEEVIRTLGTPPDEQVLSIVSSLADGNAAGALEQFARVLESGVTVHSAAKALADCFRNMMIAATCGPESDLIELPEAQRKQLGQLAGRYSSPALVHAVTLTHNLMRTIRGSTVPRALVEAALVRLGEAEKFVDPESLLKQLQSLSGGAGREKKKPILTSTPSPVTSVRSTAPGLTVQQSDSVPIRWEESWLKSNWEYVIEHLSLLRKKQIAGALSPATVVSFSDRTLKLAFDATHEVLRRRCEGPLGGAIKEAFSQLGAGEIRCEYISTGQGAPGGVPPVSAPATALSAAEKNQIHKDPAVRAVLDLFGGEIVDIRKDPSQNPPSNQDS